MMSGPDAGRLRHGIDLVELTRVGDAVTRHGARFLDRVYTPAEQAYCAGNVGSLAARFAAKEAVAKALGTGIAGFRWRDIEVVRTADGAPAVRLYGGAAAHAARLGLTDWALSLTHARRYAIASVVATGREVDAAVGTSR